MSLCAIGDTLAAGTDGAGIDLFGPDRLIANIKPSASNLPGDAVISLTADNRGNLWVGTYAGSVAMIDRNLRINDVSAPGMTGCPRTLRSSRRPRDCRVWAKVW